MWKRPCKRIKLLINLLDLIDMPYLGQLILWLQRFVRFRYIQLACSQPNTISRVDGARFTCYPITFGSPDAIHSAIIVLDAQREHLHYYDSLGLPPSEEQIRNLDVEASMSSQQVLEAIKQSSMLAPPQKYSVDVEGLPICAHVQFWQLTS